MVEKVKITKCIDTGRKTKDNRPVFDIELSDGRKGGAFDSSFIGLKMNEEIEIEIAQAKDYNNEKRYYFSVPGKKKEGSKFPQKDWTFEKRRAGLELSVQWCISKQTLKTEDVLNCASAFLNYLNPKEQ
jgi:hypothetical protein